MNRHPSHSRRQTHRRPVLVLTAAIVFLGIPSAAWGAAQDGPTRLEVSKQERLHQLEQAQIFIDRETSTLDLRTGPVDGLTFDPATVVACGYHLPGARLGGATPKFLCRVGGTVYKVEYLSLRTLRHHREKRPLSRSGDLRRDGGDAIVLGAWIRGRPGLPDQRHLSWLSGQPP